MAAIELEGLTKRFGDVVAVDGPRPHRRRGRDFRLSGPERRRQVDDDRHSAGFHPADRRDRDRARPRRPVGGPGRPKSDRCASGRLSRLRSAHRPSARRVRHRDEGRRRRSRGAARAGSGRRRGRQESGRLLEGNAPAAGVSHGAGRRSRPARPRRALDRPRSERSPRDARDHPRGERARDDRLLLESHHGTGRGGL